MSVLKRWTVYELRDYTWKSQLCSDHKLILMGVLSYMGKDKPWAYPGQANLAQRCSMSRTKTSRLTRDLLRYDWLVKGSSQQHMRRPGRRPTCFYTPSRKLVPAVPLHCLLPSKVSNLKQPQ